MAHLIQPSDLPSIFADPYLQVVDRVFPLTHRRKQYLKYYPEDQIIDRTNDFRPTEYLLYKKIKNTAAKIVRDIPEFGHLLKDDIVAFLKDDMNISRKFERYDSLRENAFVTMDYIHDLKLLVFASASSMSSLVIIISKKECFELGDYSVELPLDTMYITHTWDLEYPIRQITTSPFSSLEFKIFLVRTTSKIHLFTLNEKEGLKMIQIFNLTTVSDSNPSIDYSMPLHVEFSPYKPYEYVLVTTNGYIAIVDGLDGKILYNGIDPFPDNLNYISRWKSCSFGKTSSTILIASPECIKEWEFTDTIIQKRTLAAPNDRIISFTAKSSLYCFATLDAIFVFDYLIPERPILKWMHPMRLGAPSLLILDELEKDIWRLAAFSHQTQRLTFIEFKYTNQPTKSIIPKAEIIGLHNIKLSKYKFQELYNYNNRISSIGFGLDLYQLQKDKKRIEDKRLLCIYRLFEDGSVKVQYASLTEEEGPVDKKEIGKFITKPQYKLKIYDGHFNQILSKLKLHLSPGRQSKHLYAEVFNFDMTAFNDYLQKRVEIGNDTLSDDVKENIAIKVRQMKEPTSFQKMFKESHYHLQEYKLNDLKAFLEQLESFEDMDCIHFNLNMIPQIRQNTRSIKRELRKKLNEAYEKEIQMSSSILLPRYDDEDNFQYFNREKLNFQTTTTTKALANCWKIDNRHYRDISFPQYDFSTKLKPEEFPRFDLQSHHKRRRSLGSEAPMIVVEEEAEGVEDISLPVIKVESVSKPSTTKKNKLSSSIKHEDETTHYSLISSSPPRLSSSQPDALLPPSPARTFANISTQPTSGIYGSRKKSVSKKKKKPKTSGFR